MKVKMNKGKWLKKPRLFVIKEDSLILETEPFTSIHKENNAAEIVYEIPKDFVLKIKTDYFYQNIFDECGFAIYEDSKRKIIVSTKYRDNEITSLQSIVYQDGVGDRCVRDIASNIHTLYYRLWHRGNMLRIQYSFNGQRYRDFRELPIKDEEKYLIGLYACSPINSIFDCTFSELTVEE